MITMEIEPEIYNRICGLYSKMLKVPTRNNKRRIILDCHEENFYNDISVEGAGTVENYDRDAVDDKFYEMIAGFLSLEKVNGEYDFLNRLIRDRASELQFQRRFRRFNRSFDYDAMGTNSFETNVHENKGWRCITRKLQGNLEDVL